jgi:hypothetical protein
MVYYQKIKTKKASEREKKTWYSIEGPVYMRRGKL